MTPSNRKRSPWFSIAAPPSLPGWYEVRWINWSKDGAHSKPFMAWWDGVDAWTRDREWLWVWSFDQWRGLAEKPE